mgnify:CR=1 FL=1
MQAGCTGMRAVTNRQHDWKGLRRVELLSCKHFLKLQMGPG